MGKDGKKDSAWLLTAEVKSRIVEKNGRWIVSLIFVDINNPVNILVQTMGDYQSKKQAEIYANFMQKTAAKETKSSHKVNNDDFNINNN